MENPDENASTEDKSTLKLLQKIERNTAPAWWIVLGQGLVRGAAFTLGSVFVIALAGWALSVLGVIPGFADMAQYLRDLLPATSAP